MTVRLHIDRVVMDAGLGVASADARLLERAIIAELSWLLNGAGIVSGRDEGREGDPPDVMGRFPLGSQIARVIDSSIRESAMPQFGS